MNLRLSNYGIFLYFLVIFLINLLEILYETPNGCLYFAVVDADLLKAGVEFQSIDN